MRHGRTIICSLAFLALPAFAQPLAPALEQALGAPYLTEEQRKDMRVFHAVDGPGDRDSPARRARSALLRGALDHPDLLAAGADPLDAAEARVLAGDPGAALALIGDARSPRAVRIGAQALEQLARFDEARDLVEGFAERFEPEGAGAEDLTEAARVLTIRARLSGPRGPGGADYHAAMALLARARDQADRLYWPAYLAEAELLYEKDNTQECRDALEQATALTGECAWTRFLRAKIAVGAFDFETAGALADQIDALYEGSGLEPPSPLGAVIRASMRLRQSDPAGAIDSLDGVLSRLADMPEARALRIAADAQAGRLDRANRRLAEWDDRAPGQPLHWFVVGRTLAESRQYEDAPRYLLEAAARLPTWAAPHIELGLLYIQSGQDDLAREALTRAATLDPFNLRARNSLALLDRLDAFQTLRSEHFIVRYAPGPDRVLAEEMVPVLEAIHRRVAGPDGLDFTPARPTRIELMPDHASFAVRIAGMPRIHTIAASTGPVIALESPQDGPGHTVGPYDWARVVQHEYAHTVSLARTRNRIPHWFTEAAAVYCEGAPRDYSWCRILADAFTSDSLFTLDEISLRFVRPRTPTDRTQAYAQGHWMYEFIVQEWGREAPLRLMDRYAQGDSEAEAFASVLGTSPREFMDRFTPWAKRDLIAWGMLPPDGVPTLQQLLADDAAGPAASEDPTPTPEQIDRWLAAYPDHPEVLGLAVAQALQGAGPALDEQTIDLLRRYARARPVDPLPHQRLARHYLAADDPVRARPHLEFLDRREQHTPEYALALARIYAAEGDLDKAFAKAQRAVSIAPFVPAIREQAAALAVMRSDHDAALHHLRALAELEPDRDIHRRRIEALLRRRGP